MARSTPPTTGASPSGAIEAGLIRPGEERAFFALYRRHPRVSLRFGASRRLLEEAAKDPSACPRMFLLARSAAGAPIAAVALEVEAGRRATCFFPIATGPTRDRSVAYGELARAVSGAAAARGAVLIESEFSLNARARALEPGLSAIGLHHVTDRMLLERRLAREAPGVLPLRPIEEGDATPLLRAIYASSRDPAMKGVDAADELALFASAGPIALRAIPDPSSGRALGLAVLRLVGRTGTIVFLGIVPEQQRQGLGKTLLRASLAELREGGARIARLAVSIDNTPALALYARAGFRGVGRARLYRRFLEAVMRAREPRGVR